MVRRRKVQKSIDLQVDTTIDNLKQRVGQEVPLSHYYIKGQKPILVGIEDDHCFLRYPNGATMRDVPIKDLVDDAGYWRSQ